jgi:3-methyladenine DNA glycosylase AlkC
MMNLECSAVLVYRSTHLLFYSLYIINYKEMAETKRKGAKTVKDIPKEILAQLNKGEIETANLMEWLGVDQKLLLTNVLKQLMRNDYLQPINLSIDSLKKQTVTTVNESIGVGLLAQATKQKDKELFGLLATHTSDAVRCWATYLVGNNEKLSLQQMLQQIQPFAADKHFGVREIAWMAVRPTIAKNLKESISILATWTKAKDENVRRFASESTRPRGVWCAHIDALKENPALAINILQPLKTDPAKYVQDSVGNWLNDASKTQPKFVTDLCKQWQKESKTKETDYIIKKALRSIEK